MLEYWRIKALKPAKATWMSTSMSYYAGELHKSCQIRSKPNKMYAETNSIAAWKCGFYASMLQGCECDIKIQPSGDYNADLDRLPNREVDRRSYSVAVSTWLVRHLVATANSPASERVVTYHR